MNVASKRLFDLKSLLYLRVQTLARFQQESGLVAVDWNNRTLSALSRRVANKTGYEKGIGVRSLRTTLANPVTLHTSIPTNAAANSRLDLLCRYLDCRDFMDFQITYKTEIEVLELDSHDQVVQHPRSKSYITTQVFDLRRKEVSVSPPICMHLICYRQTPQGEVSKDIAILYPETGKAEFFLVSGIVNVMADDALSESKIREYNLCYTGTYTHDAFGYISFHLRLVGKPQFSFTGMLMVGHSLLSHIQYTGAYIATGLLYVGLWSGLLVMECAENYADAAEKLCIPVDDTTKETLKGQLLGIPFRVPASQPDDVFAAHASAHL